MIFKIDKRRSFKMKDVSFEIDEFSKNKIYEGAYALAMQLYVLLIMKPGDHPDDLEKGIDIFKYRVDFSEETASELEMVINRQVEEYCDFSINDMIIEYVDGELYIGIQSPSFQEIVLFNTDGDEVLVTLSEE
jgi:hypothetical protein